MNNFLTDFFYAFRIFFKRPGLTLLAILALAVSLGMATATFSILNGMFLKPLPFKDPDQLHQIFLSSSDSQMSPMPIPFDRFTAIRQLDCFSDSMAYISGTINLSGRRVPQRYEGAFVTADFLSVLGKEPLLGRTFSKEVDRPDGPKEILISEKVWRERFREDPDIIGSTLRANGTDHLVVGVLPEEFHFPLNSNVWMPISQALNGQVHHVLAVARSRDGLAQREISAQLNDLYASWSDSTFEQKENLQLTISPLNKLQLNSATQSLMIVTISSVIFILIVSCANVANLLIGRALTRGREIAIRSAIGATRSRIIRQLLTESLVLSLLGAIGGLLYAAWAVDISRDSQIWSIPYWMNFEMDWRVFLFVLVVMFLTALVSGLVPAWQSSKTDLNEMLKDTSHTSTSFRLGRITRFLAVIQIAFSCALLFGAGIVLRDVYQMSRVDPGFPEEEIYTMRMGLFPGDYPEEQDRDHFYDQLINKVSSIPGVSSCSVTSWLGQFGNYKEPIVIPREDNENPAVSYAYQETVSPGYFQTFGLVPTEGKLFDASIQSDRQRVAVVNEAFARAHFGKGNAVGKTVTLFGNKKRGEAEANEDWKIVGIVPTIRVSNFTRTQTEEAIIYTPSRQTESLFMTLAARSSSDRTDLQKSIQEVILSLDPNLPVYFQKTFEEYIAEQIYPFRMLSSFLLTIGLMALFLAAVSVYGMLAFNVSRRSREIGIRMALGANSRKIVAQVLRQGFVQMLAGICVGTALAFLVGHVTKNFLLGVNPMDPSVYVGVLLTLAGVATLAFFIPARRAARLSPMEALRYE